MKLAITISSDLIKNTRVGDIFRGGWVTPIQQWGGGGFTLCLNFHFKTPLPPHPPMMLCKFVTLPLTQCAFKLVTCIVSDHRSSGCQKWFRTSFRWITMYDVTLRYSKWILNSCLVQVPLSYFKPLPSWSMCKISWRSRSSGPSFSSGW